MDYAICPACDLRFKTASGMQRHYGMTHNPPKPVRHSCVELGHDWRNVVGNAEAFQCRRCHIMRKVSPGGKAIYTLPTPEFLIQEEP